MYGPTWQIAEEREKLKKPGQHFCDNYGWKLNEKYKTIQRPDKITWVGGTIYRTITPTTHIWLQSIHNPGYADVLGCSLYDSRDFSDKIAENQGKKQKKQLYKGFFSWLDQYI